MLPTRHLPLRAALVLVTVAAALPAAPAASQPQLRRLERPLAVQPLRVAPADPQEASLEKRFDLGAAFGERDVFNVTLGRPGRIRVEAAWRGTAAGLALILNGPGQTQAYAREDGSSPLRLEFEVTDELWRRGREWTISIVNFDRRGQARGRLVARYPAFQLAVVRLAPELRRISAAAAAEPAAESGREERSILPDGRVQVRYPDGRVMIYEAGCGYTIIFPDGTSSQALCNQVQPATLPALPDDPALQEFLEAHRDNLLGYIARLVADDQAQIDLYLAYEASRNPVLYEQIRLRSRLLDKLLP